MKPINTLTKNGNLVLLLVEDSENPLYNDVGRGESTRHWTVGFNAGDFVESAETQIIGWDWDYDVFTLTEATILGWEPLPKTPALNSMDAMPKDGTMVLIYVTQNDYSFDITREGWMLAIDWSETHGEGLQVCGWDYNTDELINFTNIEPDIVDTFKIHGWINFPQSITVIEGSSQMDEVSKQEDVIEQPAEKMSLHDFFTLFDYKVTEGSDFCWNCFGPNSRFIELKYNDIGGSVVFSKLDQEIFQAEVYDEAKNLAYRWMPTQAKIDYFAECEKRNVPKMEAWDGCEFVDVDSVSEFYGIVKSLIEGEDPDEDFPEDDLDVELDLPHNVIVFLALEAHKRNITLNEMINIVLREMLTKIENGEIDLNTFGDTE